jgi:hypothetical protein
VNLGLRALMNRFEEAARERGYPTARGAWKVNARGELVIALIIPPRTPGEWDDEPRATREQKKAAREAR